MPGGGAGLALVPLLIFVLLTGSTGDLPAFCNSSIETYAIFQCGQRGYFAPVPAPHSPASVTGVFWQIGFGNSSINTGLGSDGTGFESSAFSGNDSGNFPVNFLDAGAVFPAEGFPPGSICLGSNNWANSGVDGCCDNPRPAAPFSYTNAYGSLGPYTYDHDDDILNPYFGTFQAGRGYLGYYSLASMMDYPVAVLAKTPGETFFAIAAVTNMRRGNTGVTTPSDCASGFPANPATCDTRQGEWLLGNVSNGAPNAIPSQAGRSNVIPWQRPPVPLGIGATPADPNDPSGPLTVDLIWPAVAFHQDLRSVPSNNPTLDARNTAQPGDPAAAPGVGVVDLQAKFGLVRYELQVAASGDPTFTSISQSVTCPGDPECTSMTTATLTLGASACVRIRTIFGTPPRSGVTSAASCRLGRCGDVGYGVTGARACFPCAPDPNGESCNGIDDDCDLLIDEDFQAGETCDGIGECGQGVYECSGPGDSTCSTNPGSSGYVPSAELCDGLDNDCDGATDELYTLGAACTGSGQCRAGTTECAPSGAGTICSTEPGGSGNQSSAEICDAMDNDCDGATDEGLVPPATTCGVGACESTGEMACFGGVPTDTCAPGAPSTEICDGLDNDCDGALDELGSAECGVGECHRTLSCGDPSTCVPGSPSPETCDNLDNNCDGTTDGFATTCGVGQCGRSGSCTAGVNSCTPGAPSAEICDNLDNNCDGTTDSFSTTCGVGQCGRSGSCTAGVNTCTPGAPSAEICDNLDNNCDGTTDGFATTCGVGECGRSGSCTAGVNTCTPASPSAEICDGLDNDCDGTTDEGINPGGACEGTGECGAGILECGGVGGGIVCSTDPGGSADQSSPEVCDNLDNDCDGTTDAFATQCGLGACARTGSCIGGSSSCQPGQPTAETCDALDHDCDGLPANPTRSDLDGDGVDDGCDNCPNDFNPGQQDSDGDGVGNACEPLLVALLYFKGEVSGGKIILTWATASEIDNAGFNIYRSTSPTGPWEKRNAALIPSEGSATSGAVYSLRERRPPKARVLYYLLRDVDLSGEEGRRPPIEVAARKGKGAP